MDPAAERRQRHRVREQPILGPPTVTQAIRRSELRREGETRVTRGVAKVTYVFAYLT